MYKEKSSGDKGHPCFTPTVGLILAALCPSCRRYLSPAYRLWRAEEGSRHAYAREMRPKSLSGDKYQQGQRK